MTRLIIVAVAAIGLILFVAFVISRLVESRTRGLSIRMQVFLALSVIVGAFAFGLGVMVVDRIEARAVRIATAAAQDEAVAIAGILEGDLERTGAGIPEIAQRLTQEAARGADLRLRLLDERGRVVFPSDTRDHEEPPGEVSVDAPIVVGGHRVGAVRVVKPTVVVQQMLADFAPTVLVISLILGAAAAIAAGWIGSAIARPIEILSRFAERVSAGQRTGEPPAVGAREVVRLVQSIASMRRQLEGRPFVETFAADLSHELKNPVAAIRASAEVLEEGAIDDPEAARRFVGRIREATVRIERLLGDLLSLARIEARGVETFDPVDLSRIAQQVRSGLLEGADRVSVSADGDTRVRGDGAWLARAVTNLVVNGLVHSMPGSPVEVAVYRSASDIVLSVSSRGEISRHIRTRLFRRFVSTRHDRGGTGLGLAIVRAVAESHGGRAELEREGPPTVEFRIVLPMAWHHPPANARSGGMVEAAVEHPPEDGSPPHFPIDSGGCS
ncbi:MAG: two-component sensor histidine kinase [Polyangiaceae bacterium]|nr:two-component sensor histidine kinase [Polyangiaceae bacterium]